MAQNPVKNIVLQEKLISLSTLNPGLALIGFLSVWPCLMMEHKMKKLLKTRTEVCREVFPP